MLALGTKKRMTPLPVVLVIALETSKSSSFSFFNTRPAGMVSPISIVFSFVVLFSDDSAARSASSSLGFFSEEAAAVFKGADLFLVAG